MSELTQNSVSRLPARTPAKQFDYDANEIFDKPDTAKLKNKKALDQAGKYLEGNQFGVAVVASSEPKAGSEKDHLLTEARAKVVRDYLTQNFKVDGAQVKTTVLKQTKANEGSSSLVILVYPASPAAVRSQQTSPSGSDSAQLVH